MLGSDSLLSHNADMDSTALHCIALRSLAAGSAVFVLPVCAGTLPVVPALPAGVVVTKQAPGNHPVAAVMQADSPAPDGVATATEAGIDAVSGQSARHGGRGQGDGQVRSWQSVAKCSHWVEVLNG